MNHGADMYYSQHMSAGQQQPPQTVTSGNLGHYQQHPSSMLPSAPGQYPSAAYSYGYGNGLTSPNSAPPAVSNSIPQNVLPLPGSQGSLSQAYVGFDTTGQQPPPGMKPRVTATLWEDEGSLCFQVEARGICVARREDNHMINGTKLLNVAGMTRGRRDGILKSEKVRHVVKIGPMHLKGVWIPYERALEFANKEKITEMLYPLFVNNIGAMLYHPTNQSRTNQVMAAADRRKQEQSQLRSHSSQGLPSGLPSMQQQPHHAMATLPSHSPLGRPGLERAHTFPTPPASASSVMGGMGQPEGFNWQGQGMNGQQGTEILQGRGLANVYSSPPSPATTPPSSSIQTNMPPYPQNGNAYDSQRQMYGGAASQPSPYQTHPHAAQQDRLYNQPSQYTKNEMAPPSSRPSISGHPSDHQDTKPNGVVSQEQHSSQQNGDEDAEQEHEAEYTHDSGSYDPARTSYNYAAQGTGALGGDSNMSPELAGSPNHAPASGRATPRTAAPPQPYYQNAGYNTPPRVQPPGSLYNVMSNDRARANGAPTHDVYAPGPDVNNSLHNGYASQQPILNGSTSVKRGRDDEDDLSRNGNDASADLKRQRMMETPVPAPVYDAMNRSAPAIAVPRRR